MKKYNSACKSLRPGQLNRIVAGIKDRGTIEREENDMEIMGPTTINDYKIALQQAIEYHCRGELVPEDVAKVCPKYAKMLDKDWWDEQ